MHKKTKPDGRIAIEHLIQVDGHTEFPRVHLNKVHMSNDNRMLIRNLLVVSQPTKQMDMTYYYYCALLPPHAASPH